MALEISNSLLQATARDMHETWDDVQGNRNVFIIKISAAMLDMMMASSLKTNICVSRSKEKESSSNIFCSSFTKVDRCRNSSELTEHRNAEYHVQLTRFVCLIIAYKVLIRIKSKAYWTITYLFKGLERMEKLIFAHYACKVSLELVNDLDHYLFKNVLGLAKLASIRFTPIVS